MAKKKKKDEEIFEGGPKQSKVENWKQEFGSVYRIDFEDDTFIFRTLSRLEYKQLVNNIEGDEQGNQEELSWFREEQLCNKCILWPKDYGQDDMSNGKAGIPTVVSEYIMSKSGFNSKGGPQKL